MNNKTDEELAIAVQDQRTDLFEVLVLRYEKKLLRYGRKFLFDHEKVREATQEVFIKAFVNLKSFDPGQKFSSWIYRIAHNEFINIIKKEKHEPFSLFEPDIIFSLSAPDDVLGEAEKKEEGQEVRRYLEKLPAKYREPVVLYYFEEKDYREISDIMNIPISTVGVRLKRARVKIKKYYEK